MSSTPILILSRRRARPWLLACFGLMAATGALMFFHWNTPVQRSLHAWLGWLVLIGVALQLVGNGSLIGRFFTHPRLAVGLLTFALTLMLGTSLQRGPTAQAAPALAVQALGRAPLRTLAEVFGLTPAQARQVLAETGIAVPDDGTSLDAATQGRASQVNDGLKALASATQPPPR